MADWAYLPNYEATVTAPPPVTLQTVLEDQKVISRVKSLNALERWGEVYSFTKVDHDVAKAFFDAHGIATSFTKQSFDVGGTPTQERTVRFDGPWEITRVGDDWIDVALTFVRHF
jgi:hypothetical protein